MTFKTLSKLASVVSFLGWLFVGLSVLGGLGSVLWAADKGEGVIALMAIPGTLVAIVIGLIIVAHGQLINCIVAIEKNTRSAFQAAVSAATLEDD